MNLPFELLVGLRYTRAGRRGRRRDGFMSFISAISVTSIALGVMALIIVLSVMNGFQKEVRDRMLSVVSHIEVTSLTGPITDWKTEAELMKKNSHVTACAPYISQQALVASGRTVRGVMVRGIDPAEEASVSDIARTVGAGTLGKLEEGGFGLIIGKDLARILGVTEGDRLTMIVGKGNVTPAGYVPRMKQMTVRGLFSSGHYEYDSSLAFVNIADAAVLYRTGGPTGIRLRTDDLMQAKATAQEIQKSLPRGWYATDWTRQNQTWFAAVQVEKRMMAIILFLIVLVGAFGLVSALVMTVTEKQSDIAILRTMGASSRSVMTVFITQGSIVGFIGVTVGVSLGLLVACNLDVIVPAVESLLGTEFLPKEIYFISQMPSDPRASDIVPIAVFSFLMSLAATIYPSWRASRIHPAEALRYE